MTEITLEYLCRRCKAVFTASISAETSAWDLADWITDGRPPAEGEDDWSGYAHFPHDCPSGGVGVGDFVGARETKPETQESAASRHVEVRVLTFEDSDHPAAHNGKTLHLDITETIDRPGTWKITIDEDMRGTLEEVS